MEMNPESKPEEKTGLIVLRLPMAKKAAYVRAAVNAWYWLADRIILMGPGDSGGTKIEVPEITPDAGPEFEIPVLRKQA